MRFFVVCTNQHGSKTDQIPLTGKLLEMEETLSSKCEQIVAYEKNIENLQVQIHFNFFSNDILPFLFQRKRLKFHVFVPSDFM